MANLDQDHQDHVFLKIDIDSKDKADHIAECNAVEERHSIADQLAVLDAMQIFKLGNKLIWLIVLLSV